MENLIATFRDWGQEGAIVALFAILLLGCGGTFMLVAVLKSMGKWGVVALCLAAAAVWMTWMLR